MKGLLIRLDDITPDMDWDAFERVRTVLEQNTIKPLLGIVPNNCDRKLHKQEKRKDFWETMSALEKKGWVMCQHGYEHIYVNHEGGILSLNSNSEFAGLPLSEQKKKLSEGREILREHGILTDIFMAPSHSYDKLTIEAMKQTGFRYVTDGYGCCPYRYRGIGFIPCTLTKYQYRKGIDTICIHANTMTEQMLEQLDRDIRMHRSEFIDWQDVLSLDSMPKRTIRIALGEKKELFQRKLKAFVANSEAFQKYMQKTGDANRFKKLCKRVIFLPITLIKAMLEK